jgi:RNA polymerase subunit RPABC4/transcription elongation factor Spt4
MLNTFITSSEVFTLGTSFQSLIEKMKKMCPNCETAELAREYAVIDKDMDVVAISCTIRELEQRLDGVAFRAKSGLQ